MAVRVFGPIRGAGTQIQEQEGEQQISPGALGFAGMAGLFEKGPANEAVIVTNKTAFRSVFGSVTDDSLAPDAALDFFKLANGAGGLVVCRVTDGNEVSAGLSMYGRVADPTLPNPKVGVIRAQNGGRWGGKKDRFTFDLDSDSDLDETSLTLPASAAGTFSDGKWTGGYVELKAVAGKRYWVTGFDSATETVRVAADQKMKSDWTAAAQPAELGAYLVLENEGKAVAVELGDGEESPATEFSLRVLVDGDVAKTYGNLSSDPTSPRYWADVINQDGANTWITVEDTFVGAHTADTRPANHYGQVASVDPVLRKVVVQTTRVSLSAPSGADPAVSGVTGAANVRQTFTVTMVDATTGTVESSRFGALGNLTVGAVFDSGNKWVPQLEIVNGATPLAAGDVVVVEYMPIETAAKFWPDKVGSPGVAFRVVEHDHESVTLDPGAVIFLAAMSGGEKFMVAAPAQLGGGEDGNNVSDVELMAAWDPSTSPFNDIEEEGLGLVKFATPGVTSVAVQKAGAAYAAAKNHQYRYEIPPNIVGESEVLSYLNDTLGRSDYVVVHFPTYGSVPHPDPRAARAGKLKLVSIVGMILGREARMASDFRGYHKAEAGVDATLDGLLKITTGRRKLDEERLNPAGVNVIKKKNGKFVLWGDRTLHVDSSYQFKHARELMSYYEHVLGDAFDWIAFAINDPDSDADGLTALTSFFRPEWTKRALRGNSFKEAAIIKVDDELNTDTTRAQGDKIASVSLKLAAVTERFIIKIGQQGVHSHVA